MACTIGKNIFKFAFENSRLEIAEAYQSFPQTCFLAMATNRLVAFLTPQTMMLGGILPNINKDLVVALRIPKIWCSPAMTHPALSGRYWKRGEHWCKHPTGWRLDELIWRDSRLRPYWPPETKHCQHKGNLDPSLIRSAWLGRSTGCMVSPTRTKSTCKIS